MIGRSICLAACLLSVGCAARLPPQLADAIRAVRQAPDLDAAEHAYVALLQQPVAEDPRLWIAAVDDPHLTAGARAAACHAFFARFVTQTPFRMEDLAARYGIAHWFDLQTVLVSHGLGGQASFSGIPGADFNSTEGTFYPPVEGEDARSRFHVAFHLSRPSDREEVIAAAHGQSPVPPLWVDGLRVGGGDGGRIRFRGRTYRVMQRAEGWRWEEASRE